MAYTPLTQEGKNFITTVCTKDGSALLSGKNKYDFPFCNTSAKSQTWYCNISDPFNPTNIVKKITTGEELANALIYWFNKYAKDFGLDANVIAAQAYVESHYKMWNYPPNSTASGVNQFTMMTIFGVIVENLGNQSSYQISPTSSTSMSIEEIAIITNGLRYKTNKNSYNVNSDLKDDAYYNRPILHQNVIDNPGIMIKAQCYYMKYFADKCDSLASTSLFCYSRGTFMSKTYSKTIEKCIKKFENSDYYVEGVKYVLSIFGVLGDKDNLLESKGLSKGYKIKGSFGYDDRLKLTENFDPFLANIAESNQYTLYK